MQARIPFWRIFSELKSAQCENADRLRCTHVVPLLLYACSQWLRPVVSGQHTNTVPILPLCRSLSGVIHTSFSHPEAITYILISRYIKHLCISKSFTEYCGAQWFNSSHAINHWSTNFFQSLDHRLGRIWWTSWEPKWANICRFTKPPTKSRQIAVIFWERRHAGPLFQPFIPKNSI